MSWLSKLFKCVPKEERKGIQLDIYVPHWKVSSPKDFIAFLRALIDLVPDGAIIYLEGGSPRGELKLFLKEKSIPEVSHVEMGTIWPRPKVFHIPATSENLLHLSHIAVHFAEPEIAWHFHVYKDNQILLEWFDAFTHPLYISKEIQEEKISEFCRKLGIKYQTNCEAIDG